MRGSQAATLVTIGLFKLSKSILLAALALGLLHWALDARRVTTIRTGLLVYAAVFLTEGIGLVLRKQWGKWWGLLVTASFIPLEVYESARHPRALRIGVLLINLAIVWYLARSLRRAS